MNALMRDVRLLWRRSVLLILAGWLLVLISFVTMSQEGADRNWDLVQESTASFNRQMARCLEERSASSCEARSEQRRELHDFYVNEQTKRFTLAAAAQQPLASGGVVAGLLVSLPGLVFLLALCALHVGGEFRNGTAQLLTARLQSRRSFLVTKTMTIALAGLVTMLLSWVTLAAYGVYLRSAWDVPPAPAEFEASTYALSSVSKAVLVILVAAVVGTSISVSVRHVLGAWGAGVAGLLVSIAACSAPVLLRVSPAYWLAGWMAWEPKFQFYDHVWVDQFPFVEPDRSLSPGVWSGGAFLSVTGIVFALIGMSRFSQRDVAS